MLGRRRGREGGSRVGGGVKELNLPGRLPPVYKNGFEKTKRGECWERRRERERGGWAGGEERKERDRSRTEGADREIERRRD